MTTAQIIVGGMLTIVGANEKATARIVDRFSLRNPAYTERAMMKLSLHGIEERLSFAQEYPNFTIVPRGCIKEVKRILLDCDINFEIVDKRSEGTTLGSPPTSSIVPRDFQSDAIDAILKNTQGTVVLPCGTGKTKLATLSILKAQKSTLVIVPTKEILDQWANDVRDIFGVEPGIVGDGKKKFEPITIAILNSLSNLEEPDVLSEFGMVIHDECHRSCAKTNQRVLSFLPAKYRVGLTATKMREDGLEKLIDWTFGPTIFERSVFEMVSKGWLVMPEIETVNTSFEFSYDGPDEYRLHKMAEALISDSDRLQIVKNVIKERAEAPHRSILVLANRKEYCHRIQAALESDGLQPLVVTSETPKKPRKLAIEQMRSGKRNILIATSLADEGMDIRRLSDIVLAFPESAKARTIQRIGRIMRPVEGKYPMLYDIVDPLVPTLRNRWNERKRIYKSLGLIY